MAKQSGLGDNFYVGGFDLSGDVSALSSLTSPVALLDVTAVEDSAMERIVGLGDGQISFNAWFNGATGQEHLALRGLGQKGVMYCRGTILGGVMCYLEGEQTDYAGNRGADGSLAFSGTFQASEGAPLEWGIQLTAGKVTHAANGDEETGVDHGAQTTAGGVGYLQIFSVASGTATFLIEDSADSSDGDDGSWGTLLTFDTDSDSAPEAERKEVTGTVERWTRASTTGTYTNAVFAMGFRRGRASDRVSLA